MHSRKASRSPGDGGDRRYLDSGKQESFSSFFGGGPGGHDVVYEDHRHCR